MKQAHSPGRLMAEDLKWFDSFPDHWKMAKVMGHVELINGYPFDSRRFDLNEGIPLIRIRDLNSNTTEARYNGPIVEAALVKPGDIIIGMDGDFNVSRWKGEPALLNQRLCCLRPYDSIDERFLFYLLPFPLKLINNLKHSTTVKHLSSGEVRRVGFGWPPLAEQRTIATFLDRETAKIDALIDRKQRLLELLKEKRAALITQAVTKGLDPSVEMKDSGVEWFGKIPNHWDLIQLRHLVRRNTTITYGIVQAGPDVPDGVPYIRTGDMAGETLPTDGYKRTSKEIDEAYRRSRVSEGDVVVAIRATVGKALLVPDFLEGANLTQGTARVAAGSRLVPEFLLFALQSTPSQQRFAALSKGATFREITLDMLRHFEITLPPKDEQQRLVRFLLANTEKVMTIVRLNQKAISLLTEYRTALISAAVTGKIEVREA